MREYLLNRDEFPERLTDRIAACCTTQRDLAKKIGVTEAAMSRYCNGERYPRITTLVKIADALDVDAAYFMQDSPDPENAFDEILRLIKIHRAEFSDYDKLKIIHLLCND